VRDWRQPRDAGSFNAARDERVLRVREINEHDSERTVLGLKRRRWAQLKFVAQIFQVAVTDPVFWIFCHNKFFATLALRSQLTLMVRPGYSLITFLELALHHLRHSLGLDNVAVELNFAPKSN